jgi:hypothetical protein
MSENQQGELYRKIKKDSLVLDGDIHRKLTLTEANKERKELYGDNFEHKVSNDELYITYDKVYALLNQAKVEFPTYEQAYFELDVFQTLVNKWRDKWFGGAVRNETLQKLVPFRNKHA